MAATFSSLAILRGCASRPILQQQWVKSLNLLRFKLWYLLMLHRTYFATTTGLYHISVFGWSFVKKTPKILGVLLKKKSKLSKPFGILCFLTTLRPQPSKKDWTKPFLNSNMDWFLRNDTTKKMIFKVDSSLDLFSFQMYRAFRVKLFKCKNLEYEWYYKQANWVMTDSTKPFSQSQRVCFFFLSLSDKQSHYI